MRGGFGVVGKERKEQKRGVQRKIGEKEGSRRIKVEESVRKE